MAEAQKRSRPYFTPIGPLQRVVRSEVARRGAEKVARAIWPDPEEGPTRSDKTLSQLLSELLRRDGHVSFDFVDRALCALGLVHLWLQDKELSKVYQEINLEALDIVEPTCEAARLESESLVRATYARLGCVEKTSAALGVGNQCVRGIIRSAPATEAVSA